MKVFYVLAFFVCSFASAQTVGPNVPSVVIANGNFNLGSPYPACLGNCDTLGGAFAGSQLQPQDFLTTAVGFHAMGNLQAKNSESTAIGWNSMGNMTGTPGANNVEYDTAIGISTLGASDATSTDDTIMGTDAMHLVASGATQDVAIGQLAMAVATNVSQSIAIGNAALGAGNGVATTAATDDIAIGFNAMNSSSLTTANNDTAIGDSDMLTITTGSGDTAIGHFAGGNLTTDINETLIGQAAGSSIKAAGSGNNILGASSVDAAPVMTGQQNQIMGASSFNAATTASYDIVLGGNSGNGLTTGTSNIEIGYQVGNTYPTTGNGNILIGQTINSVAAATSNELNIGNAITGSRGIPSGFPSVCTLGEPCILGVLRGANFNSTADQLVPIGPFTSASPLYMTDASKYIVTGVFTDNCSVAMSTAAGGLYTASGRTGTTLVAATQTFANCTSATTMQTETLASGASINTLTGSNLYLNFGTAQGATATGDVYVMGVPFN